MSKKNLFSPLLYAASEQSADVRYFGKIYCPDPFVALGFRGKKYAVVSALEFGRFKKSSDFDVVLPLESFVQRARDLWPQRRPGGAEIIYLLAKDLRHTRFTVPQDFAAGVYEKLFELGLDLEVADGPLFPEREQKSPAEAAAIAAGNRASAAGLAAAERLLRASRIRGRSLLYQGKPLTSERLKLAIETACLEVGAVSLDTIVAGGDQGCDPHDRGSGPLRANELIVVDIFPRVVKTGYHGDMTRTFLRGRASEAQRKLVATVRDGQKLALKTIRAGINGRTVHGKIVELFNARGFQTKHTPKGSVGFFHGTGHGLGLEVHEPPRMNSTTDYALKKNSVVTVEPGLYYPGIGGCRIEDVVQVTATGVRMLSGFHYHWEL